MDGGASLDGDVPAARAGLLGDDPGRVALTLAGLRVAVFPLHTPDPAGACSCGRPCGRDAGKHPRPSRGLLAASTDAARIAAWWTAWPGANLAVATGTASGVWVLDVDPGTGGEASVARLEGEHGPLPETWAVETGGGGLHLWFAHPGGVVPTSAGRLGPGLDVRGDGGYAVAPPSLHRSGERYRWGEAWHPAKVPLAKAPPWLLQLVAAPAERKMVPPEAVSPSAGTGENHPAPTGGAIAEGGRNATLASLAGTMRRRGFSEAAILAGLLAENAASCQPPLPEAEVAKVARSIARYAPDPSALLSPALSVSDLGTGRPRPRPGFVEFVGGKAVIR